MDFFLSLGPLPSPQRFPSLSSTTLYPNVLLGLPRTCHRSLKLPMSKLVTALSPQTRSISLCLLPQVPGPEPLNPSVHCTLSFPRCLVGHQILLMTEPKPTSGQSQLPTCQLEAWPLLRPSASVLWPGWSQQPPTLLMAASVHTRPGVPFPKMIDLAAFFFCYLTSGNIGVSSWVSQNPQKILYYCSIWRVNARLTVFREWRKG